MAETKGSTSTRNILAVVVVSCLYKGQRSISHVCQISAEKHFSQPHASAMINFSGDQAAPSVRDKLREVADNGFMNSAAVSITTAFLTFFEIAHSTLIYSYKLAMKSLNQGRGD